MVCGLPFPSSEKAEKTSRGSVRGQAGNTWPNKPSVPREQISSRNLFVDLKSQPFFIHYVLPSPSCHHGKNPWALKDSHFSPILSIGALVLEFCGNWRNGVKADGYHLLPFKGISLLPKAILNRRCCCRIPLQCHHGDCPSLVNYTPWIALLNPSMFIPANRIDTCWQAAKMESCRFTTCPIVEGRSWELSMIFPNAFINPLLDPLHALLQSMTLVK